VAAWFSSRVLRRMIDLPAPVVAKIAVWSGWRAGGRDGDRLIVGRPVGGERAAQREAVGAEWRELVDRRALERSGLAGSRGDGAPAVGREPGAVGKSAAGELGGCRHEGSAAVVASAETAVRGL
jgi:hypothetical protein